MNKLKFTWRGSVLLVLVLFAFSICAAQTPEVLKVEPPNWWTGSTLNPVRVLVHGKNFAGAKVEAVGAGIKASNVKISAAGTYLFIDVTINKNAQVGRRQLRITTANGTTDAPFDVVAPLSREGRFQGFSPDDVIYLIMPDRFADGDQANNEPPVSRGMYDRTKGRFYHGGDLRGIINHLSYLKELGVTAIWTTPWYDNVNHLDEREKYDGEPTTGYHGYGAIDYYGVEEHFGTMSDLRELVDRAHALGIKIIQDQVANHTGPYHDWVKDAPTPTWYNGTETNHTTNPFQPWTLQDPHGDYTARRDTLEGWFVNILPDMNQNDPEVARYEIQNAIWWIGTTGLDAIRQDTMPYVPRTFWREWSAAIKREFPNVKFFGEVYDGDPALVSFFQGGVKRYDGVDSGFDSVFDFPLMFQTRDVFAKGAPLRELSKMLAHDYLYPNPSLLVTFIGNHDIPRFKNEPNATNAGLKLAMTFLLTMRGVPQLYYGDEIGMQGAGDPDNRRDFPGGFAGDPRNAFTQAGRSLDEQDVFAHVRKLLQLRKELEPLRRGNLVHLYITEQQYAYARVTDKQSVVIAINNDSKAATIEFDATNARLKDGAMLTNRLGNGESVLVTNGKVKVNIPARSAVMLSK